MQLGNFLGKLKGETKVEPKQFLALVMTDDLVQAAVWHVAKEQTEIAAIGTPVEWDGDTGTTSELITAVDATISSAVEGLSEEPTDVILGIPQGWTDKSGILGSKRTLIKSIGKELELKLLGFVVITDSIVSYLKIQEGTPTSSIIIQVMRDELTFILVRLGRIEAVETLGRSEDIVADVTEGVTRFKDGDNLPSRIILFNSMHALDELIQNLLSVDWQKDFNFLHTPKVEALAKDVAIRALGVAGGTEVAKSLGVNLSEDNAASPASPTEADKVQVPEEPQLLTATEIGFTKPTNPVFVDPEETIAQPSEEPVSPNESIPARHRFVMPAMHLPKINLPTIKFNLPGVKRHYWIALGALIFLGVVFFYLVWALPTATVTIYATPKNLDQEVELTLRTDEESIDFGARVVPAEIELVTQQGEKVIETTGKKIVGETSEGPVTIFNRTVAAKTFPKGTSLNSGNLKFTLDSEITVASGSASNDYVGKASTTITAVAIGKESNLTAGTEFTVLNFGKDSYVAKADAALSGGTSEEVRVVETTDLKRLTQELTQELTDKLEKGANTNNSPGTGIYLIPSSIKLENVEYSAKIGEVASSLKGDLTLTATLLRYQTEDVTTLINSTIDSAVPSGFVRANIPSTVDLSASNVSADGSSVQGTAKIQVALLPKIDTKLLQSSLKGAKDSEIAGILQPTVPGYEHAEVVITPRWLPPRFKSLPLNANNIVLEIVASTL